MSAPDIAPAALTTLMADAYITSRIGTWKRRPAIYSRRPVPGDAPYPMIIINPNSTVTNFDYLNSIHPWVFRDILVYGQQGEDTKKSQLRVVDEVAYRIRELFHRKRFALQVEGYNTVNIVATGPQTAPVDDDQSVGRLVSLSVQLQEKGSNG